MLAAATATRGGGHTTGAFFGHKFNVDEKTLKWAQETFGVDNPFSPLEYEGRPETTLYMEAMHRAANSFGVCHFNTIHWDLAMSDLPHLAEMYRVATGWDTSVEELKRKAMMQLNLEKAFNLRFTDFGRKDDFPPPREQHEAIPSGPMAGWKLDLDGYDRMLSRYYALHGWNPDTGYPTRSTLEGLGLASVADDLERIGKLGEETGF